MSALEYSALLAAFGVFAGPMTIIIGDALDRPWIVATGIALGVICALPLLAHLFVGALLG